MTDVAGVASNRRIKLDYAALLALEGPNLSPLTLGPVRA